MKLGKQTLVFKSKLKMYSGYVFMAVSILLIISFVGTIVRLRSASGRVGEVQDRIMLLEEENSRLDYEAQASSADVYVERQLRDNLQLSKEGEIVVVLPDDEILRKLAPEKAFETQDLLEPNWKQWLGLFL